MRMPSPYLRIGTCSWKYDSWKGLVYRPDVAYGPNDYLADYAKRYSTVEVDQWFWSLFPSGIKLPDPRAVAAYAASVPGDFVFTVKAPNALTLTHFYSRQPARSAAVANRPNPHFLSPELLARFLAALAPLGGKLGPIMLQFEYLNRKKMASGRAFLDRLAAFAEALPPGREFAIEVRNPNYLDEELFAFLKERGLGFVLLEGYHMPAIAEIFDRFDTATAPYAIVRLHGWDREGIEERAGMAWNEIREPKDESLRSVARIVRENERRRVLTYVNVNNHYEGSAPLTIDRLAALLAEE